MPIKTEVMLDDKDIKARVVEVEGAVEAVRHFKSAAEAVKYLQSRKAYYKQPEVAAENIEEGVEVENDKGARVLEFRTLQGAITYFKGEPDVAEKKEEAEKVEEEKEEKEEEVEEEEKEESPEAQGEGAPEEAEEKEGQGSPEKKEKK